MSIHGPEHQLLIDNLKRELEAIGWRFVGLKTRRFGSPSYCAVRADGSDPIRSSRPESLVRRCSGLNEKKG